MIRRWFFIVLALAGFTGLVSAQEELSQAEEAYRQGRFSQALQLYEKELKNHPNDPFVYYNIGNCYFKMGSKGLAAANYYRAFLRAPRDMEIRHNLALVRAGSGEQFVPAGVPEIVHRIYFGLSFTELTGLLFLLFWLSCFMGSFWLIKRKGTWCLGACVFLTLVVLGWWYTRNMWESRTMAVIASPVAEMRSGPGTNFPASASITQGHLLTVQDAKDSWYEVVVPSQGIKGWVEKSAVEKI